MYYSSLRKCKAVSKNFTCIFPMLNIVKEFFLGRNKSTSSHYNIVPQKQRKKLDFKKVGRGKMFNKNAKKNYKLKKEISEGCVKMIKKRERGRVWAMRFSSKDLGAERCKPLRNMK